LCKTFRKDNKEFNFYVRKATTQKIKTKNHLSDVKNLLNKFTNE